MWFFEKINKISISLANEKKKTQITKIMNERKTRT